MKIAFIHYHLKPGGVTTVLKQQVSIARETGEVLIITGEPGHSDIPEEIVCIPEIGYDIRIGKIQPPEQVAESICHAILSKWPEGCDILHVHNPLLKKNSQFLNILKALQKKGFNLFLQVHDFAEDGRPGSYFKGAYVADCHYGVINSRDYHILIHAGLKPDGLHQLSNMIDAMPYEEMKAGSETQVLYPVRAIRRKNLGEAILLSLFLKNRHELAITLPPNSPMDIRAYEDWKRFVGEHHLNVTFEKGVETPLPAIMSSSHFLITTSITEGFGFLFLEPWAAKKPLWGRDLPDITRDFKKNGVNLKHLYSRLRIPVSWINLERFRERWRSAVLKNSRLFSYAVEASDLNAAFSEITRDKSIDFGLLAEALQRDIISMALSDEVVKRKLVQINPFLYDPARVTEKADLIEQNRDSVLRRYGESVYRNNLLRVYNHVATRRVTHRINKTRLLKSFFTLNNFSLLKWGDYAT